MRAVRSRGEPLRYRFRAADLNLRRAKHADGDKCDPRRIESQMVANSTIASAVGVARVNRMWSRWPRPGRPLLNVGAKWRYSGCRTLSVAFGMAQKLVRFSAGGGTRRSASAEARCSR